MSDIETRLRSLEDRLEIQQLFIDYGRHLDRGDFESYANLFVADGEIMIGPMGRAKGREQIKTMMESTMAGRVGDSVHIVSSPAIEIDGDTATSEVMWTVVNKSGDGPKVTMTGRHLDDLVRDDGRWRFKRRRGLLDLGGLPPSAS
jgi:uncharacterized protein (TIGR02246 family)